MDMSRSRSLEFLRKHQPLPSDDALDRSDLDELDLIIRHLTSYPDVEVLDLLLGVFGDGSGFGVYQQIEDAVAVHERSVVVPALRRRLASGPRSVRYWCAQIASGYSDDSLVDPLVGLLCPDDYDLRYAAITALENIGTDRAIAALRTWLPKESDRELRENIQETLGD